MSKTGANGRRMLLAGGLAMVLLAQVAPVALAQPKTPEMIAVVNGQPIYRGELVDTLIDAFGVEILQQLVMVELATQETKRLGLQVSKQDIAATRELALNRIARDAGMSDAEATPENKERALLAMLRQRRLSVAEFELTMVRNAHLRKLAEDQVHITEETIREEFHRTHGAKVRIRHIQIAANDSQSLQTVQQRLEQGDDFAELARTYSVNESTSSNGGQIPPFTFLDEKYPPAMREAAFVLKEGKISPPIRVGNFVQILKLEERIEPVDVNLDDVRGEVVESLRERMIVKPMEDWARRVWDKANIKIVEPALRARYAQFLDESALR